MRHSFKCFCIITLLLVSVAKYLHADEVKWICIGMLHNWFSSAGCEIEVGRRHRITDQQDGFKYPALYRWQDMQAAKGLFIGTTNYSDPLMDGYTFDNKVVRSGPKTLDEATEFMPAEFKLIGKFNHPMVYVDDQGASEAFYRDYVDEIDKDLLSDRMLYNVVNTAIGVTVKRRVYAFSQSYHDNYHIFDFVFKNDGIYDAKGNKHNLTLTDVVIFLQHRWAMTKYPCAYGYYWTPQTATWGHNTVNELLHPKYGDPYRAAYAWHGLHSKYEGNNIGAPNTGGGTKGADGFLGAPQFPGVITLHVDKSVNDKSDDDNQFIYASHHWSGSDFNRIFDQFNASKMNLAYESMTRDIPEQTHACELGYPHNPSWQDAPFGDTQNADEHPNAAGGGISQGLGYGPYTLAPGDSIHIVLAECVGSISWERRKNVGAKWLNQITPYILPDGSETNDPDQYKDAWVFTSRDSLFNTFERAISTWNNGLVTDPAPPPPEMFTVTSGGDHITLDWSDNAQKYYDHFGGYRIYRQVGTPDTTFELIYECGEGTPNPIDHQYEDFNAQRGFDYYYYITTYDDGTVNTIEPGQPIESSLFWTRTIEPAYLRRMPGEKLADIRIVPNPFNINARSHQFGEYGKDRIMFYNLPPECEIKIFTERGDLIKSINHNDGSGDEAWDSVTSSQQMIVSGVYVAHFSTSNGKSAHKKFIVIR